MGAMGGRDIGQIFPDTDPKYKDVRSTELLKEVVSRIKEQKLEIMNIDSIVIAEKPKLASYIDQMKEVLCPILEIKKDNLGVKAKTNEGLGVIGKREAIASLAQVLVKRK
jgi:2-C-methyl-D-erythritol 2,4-cyclodiphosphate synthase